MVVSPNSFFNQTMGDEGDGGSCWMRERMMVVLPAPKYPVKQVIGQR